MPFRDPTKAAAFVRQIKTLAKLVDAGKVKPHEVDAALRAGGYQMSFREAREGVEQLDRVASGKLTPADIKALDEWRPGLSATLGKMSSEQRADLLAQAWGLPSSVVRNAVRFVESEQVAAAVTERRAAYDKHEKTGVKSDPSKWADDAKDRAALRATLEASLVEQHEFGATDSAPEELDLPRDTSLRDTIASAFDNVAARESGPTVEQ